MSTLSLKLPLCEMNTEKAEIEVWREGGGGGGGGGGGEKEGEKGESRGKKGKGEEGRGEGGWKIVGGLILCCG